MLELIASSLQELVVGQKQVLSDVDRLTYFLEHAKVEIFSRKEYMELFKDISSFTASRDLKKGVALGILIKLGDKRLTKYKFKSI